MPFNRAHANLNSSTERAIDNIHSNGISGPQLLDIPQGIKIYRLTTKMVGTDQHFNIVPWDIETGKHPSVARGLSKIGDSEFYLDLWAHRVDGVMKGWACCTEAMYGTPCAYEEELKAAGISDVKKASRRSIFWVQPLDAQGNYLNGDPTPQLFMVSHNAFTEGLLAAARLQGQRSGIGTLVFADPTIKGFTVAFGVSEKKMGNGGTYAVADNFAFLPRTHEISEEITNKIPGLDAWIHIPSREEIHEALYGRDESALKAAAASQPAPAMAAEMTASSGVGTASASGASVPSAAPGAPTASAWTTRNSATEAAAMQTAAPAYAAPSRAVPAYPAQPAVPAYATASMQAQPGPGAAAPTYQAQPASQIPAAQRPAGFDIPNAASPNATAYQMPPMGL